MLCESNLLTEPKRLYMRRKKATGRIETLENWSGYFDKLVIPKVVLPALAVAKYDRTFRELYLYPIASSHFSPGNIGLIFKTI